MLAACGRQFVDWSADYRVFSKDRWDAHQLFVPILRRIVKQTPSPQPVVVALDDTLVRKTGRKTPGVAYRRDPLSPPFHTNFVRGQRFLQLAGLLPAQGTLGPARAIPLRFKHVEPVPKPKRSAPPEAWTAYRATCRRKNLSTHAVDVLGEIRDELDHRHHAEDRTLLVTVDGSYTNATVLKGLPERTTLIGRIRKDAKLFQPPRKEDQPTVGAKRRYGTLAPTPEQLRQDATIPWQEVEAFATGKPRRFRVKTIRPVLWKKAGADRLLRMVVIAPTAYRLRKGSKLLYRQPAYLICTDPDLPLGVLIQYYLWRWDIEVNHRDEKQIIGVGQAQVRSQHSVDRQPALAVASYAILLLAAAETLGVNGTDATLPPPRWQQRQPRQRLSAMQLVRQLRSELWAHGIDHHDGDFDGFVTLPLAITKCPKLAPPLPPAVLYAGTG